MVMEKKTSKYDEIKAHLETQKRRLLSEAGVLLGNGIMNSDNFPDLGDQATAETNQNYLLRIKEREQKLLKKIDEAIQRINDGTFGICEECGEEIEYKRLLARPVTTCCIKCKTMQENYEKLREE